MDATINFFCGRIAVLRGARSFAYLQDMSQSLCAVRRALHPANKISGGIR
jgi:hypothetical protein